MKLFSKFILRITGWKIVGGIPPNVTKCVVIMAPHTSMWDFIWGRLAYWVLGVKAKFLIKKEMFGSILGPLLKKMGGIPVDRSKSSNTVDAVADLFNHCDSLFITITPEATRKLNLHWKKGFYYIALQAKVPIAFGYLDYEKKEGGIGKLFTPTGNIDEDFKVVEDFYRGHKAKHPEKFNLS